MEQKHINPYDPGTLTLQFVLAWIAVVVAVVAIVAWPVVSLIIACNWSPFLGLTMLAAWLIFLMCFATYMDNNQESR